MIIPPKTAPQPMRITCRYIRENALLHPPELNEAEGKHKARADEDYTWQVKSIAVWKSLSDNEN